MASEETPLLRDQTAIDHEAVYNRFTPSHKRVIASITALTATFPMLTSGSFIPLIPQIAHDLGSTGSVVSLAVSLSILANAVGSLTWATYSGFYGRRPILLASLAIFCIGSVGSGAAATVKQLLIWRVIQAFGISSGLSVGIGVLADIYKMEERGAVSGVFFGAVLFGMAVAPTVAGFAAHYFPGGWRTTQYGLCVAGALAWTLTALFQPETSQPGARGVDQLIAVEGKSRWVWLNPFESVALLRSPNVLFISLSEGLAVITDYVLLVPVAYTFGVKYNITNEAIIGALCIPVGFGNIVGSAYAGRLSDRIVVSLRKSRGGIWVPEDRLKATVIGGLILTPVSILLSGILTQFYDGTICMLLNLCCLFLNGVGVSILFNPANSYLVDILHDRSAQVTAANMALRNLVVAMSVGFILPSIDTFGIAITFAGAAVIAWVGFGLICAIMLWGHRMRAWVDLGFTTAQNN